MSSQRGLGLTKVPTADIKQLLLAIHHGKLNFPLYPAEVACIGLQHRVEAFMESMRFLDERGVRAVLVAVLAERARAEK
ncbi:MAG: hypothetical protein ACI9WU_004526 [Myxococcota bacterium]|jgi:hypothetical protein